jgi:phage-related minor tail protein
MIDSFGEAKFSFSDFAQSFIRDMAKMISQALVFTPLMNSLKGLDFGSIFGFAKGGSFGNLGLPQGVYTQPMAFPMVGTQPKAFAHGGTFGVMAERGAEAIVPLKRTVNGDLGVKSSPVIVNVNNNTQAEVSVQQTQGPDGATMLNIMVERKVREMLGKGSLDRQMMVQYGLNRQPA